MEIKIERLVPTFILRDREGYALAKAIERALEIIAEKAEAGISCILDPDEMPVWRLDELAGELGCLYDYGGTEAQKRYWIKNAQKLYSVYGTPQAIYNYLEGVFAAVKVEEWFEYGGEPFHFRVTISDADVTETEIEWAAKAVEAVKRLGCTADGFESSTDGVITVSAETDGAPVAFRRAGDTALIGLDENGL